MHGTSEEADSYPETRIYMGMVLPSPAMLCTCGTCFVVGGWKRTGAVHRGDFVAGPGFFLLRRARHGKARYTVQDCCSEIECPCLGHVVGFYKGEGVHFESFGGGEECGGVGVKIVRRSKVKLGGWSQIMAVARDWTAEAMESGTKFDSFDKDWLEVSYFAVEERMTL